MNNKQFSDLCTLKLAAFCLHRTLDEREKEIIGLFQDALERLDYGLVNA